MAVFNFFKKKQDLEKDIKQELCNSGLSTGDVEWILSFDHHGNKTSEVAKGFQNLSEPERARAGACILLIKASGLYISMDANKALKSQNYEQLDVVDNNLCFIGDAIKGLMRYLDEIYVTPALRGTNIIHALSVADNDVVEAASRLHMMKLAITASENMRHAES